MTTEGVSCHLQNLCFDAAWWECDVAFSATTSVFMWVCICLVCVSVCAVMCGGSQIQWPRISSPCWRCRCRNVSCRPPRMTTVGGLWSELSCSHSGLRHLEKEKQRSSKRQQETVIKDVKQGGGLRQIQIETGSTRKWKMEREWEAEQDK